MTDSYNIVSIKYLSIEDELYKADSSIHHFKLPAAYNSGGDCVAFSDRLQQQQPNPCRPPYHLDVNAELDHRQYGGKYHHCCHYVC